MKELIFFILGVAGAFIINALGGWDAGLEALTIFIAIDMFTGVLVATIFRSSPKTDGGAVSSGAIFKGIIKKVMILLYVAIGSELDYMLGSDFIRNAVIIAFIVSELISITENAGLMGVPMPSSIKKAIDVLQKKGS